MYLCYQNERNDYFASGSIDCLIQIWPSNGDFKITLNGQRGSSIELYVESNRRSLQGTC